MTVLNERTHHKGLEEPRNLFPDSMKTGLPSESSRIHEGDLGSDRLVQGSLDTIEQSSNEGSDKQSLTIASLRPRKDIWDKIAALAPIISGLMIFITGGWFTYTYNQQQLKLQEIQTIEKFIPHLTGNEQSKKAAILAISSLTDAELASKIAAIFASRGTVSALQSMAETGSEHEKSIATKALAVALENLAAREMRLSEIETAYKQALDSKGTQSQPQIQGPNAQGQPQTPGQAQPTTQSSSRSAVLPHLTMPDSDRFSDREIIANLSKLADFYTMRGKYDQAEPLLKRALTLSEHVFGPDSTQAAEVIRTLSALYKLKGDPARADQFAKRARAVEPADGKNARNEATESSAGTAHAGEQDPRSGEADSKPAEQSESKSAIDRTEESGS